MTQADHESPDLPAIRVIRRADRSADTPQTDGIHRLVALDGKTFPDGQLSAFTSFVQPRTWTAAHHHGAQDTVLFVLSGQAAYAWGERLENVAWAAAGDFVYIPAGVVHQEINPSRDVATEWVVVRSGAQPVVVNLTELDRLAEHRAAACLSHRARQAPDRHSG
ncbi:MAG: cupin domain-containing protein [Streptosporangiaceae bacterium]